MTRSKKELLEQIKEDELVELCSKLIQIPSDNPPGDTSELASFIKEYLEKNGIRVETYEPQPGIVSLIASVGEGSPHLILNGHLDQFIAEVGEPWSVGPHSGTVKDGRIYGRGSGDMKGGLASLLYTFIKFSKKEFKGKLTFTGTSDEETGGKWGAHWLFKNHSEKMIGDALLNGEPSGLTIRIGEKAHIPFLIQAEGKAAHGSFSGYVGENAIMKMVKIFPAIECFQGMEAVFTPETKKLTELVMLGYTKQYGHESKTMADVLKYVTVNIGIIKGGTKNNIVPAHCEIEVDVRLPLGIQPTEIKAEIEKKIHQIDPTITIDFKRDLSVLTPSTYSSHESKIAMILYKNSETITGETPYHSFTSGGTDCRFWRLHDIPSVSYGPKVYGMGGVDENITIEDLMITAKVHLGTIHDFFSES